MDNVNSPSHYKQSASPLLAEVRGALLTEDFDPEQMECFDALINMLGTVEEIRGYLRGNSLKYRWRYLEKAGVESLKKAEWYEKKLEKLEGVVAKHAAWSSDDDYEETVLGEEERRLASTKALTEKDRRVRKANAWMREAIKAVPLSAEEEASYLGLFCEPVPERVDSSYIQWAMQGYDYLADEFNYPAPSENKHQPAPASQGVSP